MRTSLYSATDTFTPWHAALSSEAVNRYGGKAGRPGGVGLIRHTEGGETAAVPARTLNVQTAHNDMVSIRL